MWNSRSEKILFPFFLLGVVAWLFYAGGLRHYLYFSHMVLVFALVVGLVVSTSLTRSAKFPPIPTIGRYLFTYVFYWLSLTILFFGSALAILALPVFFVSSTETHIFKFVKWDRGAYRSQGNLKFHCSARVVAESQTYLPGRQLTVCVDEFPAPRDRIGLIEVELTDLGYVSLLRLIRPHRG